MSTQTAHLQPAGPRDERGLTGAEVAERRASCGWNDVVETIAGGRWAALGDTLRDPMLWFLVATSCLFALLGDHVEAVVLAIATLPLAGMDVYLNRRIRASTEGLAGRLATSARVVRDGVEAVVPARELVPGDLALVSTGDSFPADGVFVRCTDLRVDESALTGEAFPVAKHPRREDDRGRSDAEHLAFAGTRVLTGSGAVVVTAIGAGTRYGAIVRSVAAGTRARTPLQVAVANLVTVLLVVALALCVVLAWIRWQQGHGIVDALVSAVTLAVAALPEEFPVVLTFYLGVGVYRLAARQALVRRAVVVENIGRASAICTDKTGTVTAGQLQLAHLLPAEGVAQAGLLRAAAAASRSETGDPLDTAILAATPAPADRHVEACFPFTEDRKRETVVFRTGDALLAAQKGAPEVVIAACSLDPAARTRWLGEVQTLAAGAHKVIACAERSLDAGTWPGGEPDRGFRFLGLLAFEDPVRPGVAGAVQRCRAAGIRVLMLTGDHPATARAVAREIGLGGAEPNVVEGAELAAILDRDDPGELAAIDVIARAQPTQKLAMVRALADAGHVVAVTGDGVNDVPALHAADIGIAMGGRGTRSAREAAAIVLLNDDFASIVGAIAEGRQLFADLQRCFAFLLMMHLPLVFTATVIPLAGYPLLYLPVHVVWFELMIHPIAMFVFQRPAAELAAGTVPQGGPGRFFDRSGWVAVVAVGAAIAVLSSVTYVRALGDGTDVAQGRAMAMAMLSVATAALTLRLAGWRRRKSRIAAAAVLGSALVFIHTPMLNAWLHLRALHVDDWLLALAAGAAVLLLLRLLGPVRPAARARPGRRRR